VQPLGVKSDLKGLDYFIDQKDELSVADTWFEGRPDPFIALVTGGSFFTKKIPLNKLREICRNATLPVVLLGGKEDVSTAALLQDEFPKTINVCGQYTLGQSASVIKQAAWVITSDTGLMHMAAAFEKKIISVWGNTLPEFGMGPYLPHPANKIMEVKELSCRPCSKLGYDKCPKGHFKCMQRIDFSFIKKLD
jgi:ADP-heptose:LPS heptosyltransferase